MMTSFSCKATQQGLSSSDFERVIAIIRDGGLCILPSDSSYVLTGRVTEQGITNDIDILLKRNGMKMPLAFSSLRQINTYMKLSNMAHHFLKRLTPGGLTLVALPEVDEFIGVSCAYLNADGTIGVRLTDSLVERQLADDFPLPSTPIRDANNHEVLTAEEALAIIQDRLSLINKPRRIALIDGPVPYPSGLSTVVKEVQYHGYWNIVVIRQGRIPMDVIKKTAIACQYEGILLSEGKKTLRRV